MENKKCLLAVDDDPVSLKNFISLLTPEYEILAAKSAVEATIQMEKKRPDLILLDIEMPDISGFEFLHTIKKNPKFIKIPVIIISTHSGSDIVAHSEKIGASAILTKPVTREDLLQKIKYALEHPPKNIFGI